jgi:triacylglycerol lipase
MRKLQGALVALFMVVGFAACNPAPVAPTGPTPIKSTALPIVFVYGWNGGDGTWTTMVGRFEADGLPASKVNIFEYDDSQSNVITAGELGTYIDQVLAASKAKQVDVVTHSMGSLSIRYLLKNNTSYWPKVAAVAAMAGPNHGTDLADLWFGDAVAEMRPGSDFLNALNAGDETPGPAVWTTWASSCDEVIIPDTSPPLVGANNIMTACLDHSAIHDDLTVYEQVRAAIGD